MDAIFALSSGQPPAAIGVVRISGPAAFAALEALTARPLPPLRRAVLAELRHRGEVLDRALVLRFEAPATATGEDLVELHLHGGRAVIAGVLGALADMPGLRAAEPGEFTRRALAHGRIDLTEAEGLADLLAAETEVQRRQAMRMAGGALSRAVAGWARQLLMLAAAVEARLDFGDEGDVETSLPADWHSDLAALRDEIARLVARPPAERLRDGVRVVLAGPPNAGKSSLLNALAGRDAAITSEVAGTTRDLIEAPVAIGGVPFVLIDTAGLRDSDDRVEVIGIARAEAALAGADIVVWLGCATEAPKHDHLLQVRPKADLGGDGAGLPVSAVTGAGLATLQNFLLARSETLLPREGETAVNSRQRAELAATVRHFAAVEHQPDLLLVAEELRLTRLAFDRLTGRAGVEDMLDALFGRFCIGK